MGRRSSRRAPSSSDSPVARRATSPKGKLHIRYKVRGESPIDRKLDGINVETSYDDKTRKWLIAGHVRHNYRNTPLKITYDEISRRLFIDFQFFNSSVWDLKPSHKFTVTIPPDRSSFRIDFVKHIEATNRAGSHSNLMRGSWLEVTR